METLWTLYVENFGRIERADIDVSPLTLFVGDNNSGKSYLLALLYGLMCADKYDILANLCEDSSEYQKCAEWLEKAIEQGKQVGDFETPFDDCAYAVFESLLNRILQSNQKEILRSIFNNDLSAGNISVTFSRGKNETLRLIFAGESLDSVTLSFSFRMSLALKRLQPRDRIKTAVVVILTQLITRGFSKLNDLFHVVLLPTDRAGLLLVYKILAKDAFSRAYGPNQKQDASLFLTSPLTDFLGNLATINPEKSYSANEFIVRFIEDNIIHGKIIVSNEMPLPDFYYLPEKTEIALPMSLSSDVVKQMTPLLAILQHQPIDALCIEEPEINLHPELQQMAARTLIKLVNAGTPVFAATHSDIILQHLNNMIKLNNLPAARKQNLAARYGFDWDELISADKISIYQFDVQGDGRTIVRKLSHGDYGFGVPTFYKPLETLFEQTRETKPDED